MTQWTFLLFWHWLDMMKSEVKIYLDILASFYINLGRKHFDSIIYFISSRKRSAWTADKYHHTKQIYHFQQICFHQTAHFTAL